MPQSRTETLKLSSQVGTWFAPGQAQQGTCRSCQQMSSEKAVSRMTWWRAGPGSMQAQSGVLRAGSTA